MELKNHVILISIIAGMVIFSGCLSLKTSKPAEKSKTVSLTSVQQINSFRPATACDQALEVINNNSYSQDFFEEVFTKIIKQCKSSKSPQNADIIWEGFIVPLKQTGKVPEDLAVTFWNYYFSRQFVSLPDTGGIESYCYKLPEIKKNMEKEYQMKKDGFAACEQGLPDSHFLNAMYVYNAMWAACHPVE